MVAGAAGAAVTQAVPKAAAAHAPAAVTVMEQPLAVVTARVVLRKQIHKAAQAATTGQAIAHGAVVIVAANNHARVAVKNAATTPR